MKSDQASMSETTPLTRPAGRPRACEVAERTHKLIDTAGRLFLEKGYGKVSLEMIAREAHVAVRTIYVKFGGKDGLLTAVLEANRERFFNEGEMDTDQRPLREIVDDFARHFLELVTAPEAISMQRIAVAEAEMNPELGRAFYLAGPKRTRDVLLKFFSRADIRAQIRDDVALELLPVYLLNCLIGDPFSRFLLAPVAQSKADIQRQLDQRMELFYRSVLRQP